MKRNGFCLLLVLALLFSASAGAENIIHNKITDPQDNFAFPEDAVLLEIFLPQIYDCDAALIRCGEYSMLLDGTDRQWPKLESMLLQQGVEKLTYAFLSHPHTDHCYGFQYILPQIRPDTFLHAFPEDYPYSDKTALDVYAALHRADIPFRAVGDGDTIPFGDVQITVHQRQDADNSCNNNSAMLKVTYGERSMLFTADIQMNSQRRFAAEERDLKADIMKSPHHGYNRTQQVFMDAVDPQLVLVTSYPNTAGTAAQLQETHIPFHYTYLGVIRLATDGHVWTVERLP